LPAWQAVVAAAGRRAMARRRGDRNVGGGTRCLSFRKSSKGSGMTFRSICRDSIAKILGWEGFG
jgi:hypothetical protein